MPVEVKKEIDGFILNRLQVALLTEAFRLVAEGYLARRSAHSRGSTVDLTIAPLDDASAAPDPACGVRGAKTLEFGTGVDCMDPASATASKDISETARKNEQTVVDAVKRVADTLGNTPAVCRQYYIHPAVLDAYLSGDLHAAAGKLKKRANDATYKPSELLVLHLLQKMGYGG